MWEVQIVSREGFEKIMLPAVATEIVSGEGVTCASPKLKAHLSQSTFVGAHRLNLEIKRNPDVAFGRMHRG